MQCLRYHSRNFRLPQPGGTVGAARQQIIETTKVFLPLGILRGGVWTAAFLQQLGFCLQPPQHLLWQAARQPERDENELARQQPMRQVTLIINQADTAAM
ncbi:hypothetical protein [Hymenobacter convexus]|uniref:hypothetical protein n=1 Tax=Hymenobacter sp. CA1UV-4 TaxID=3063782 RepID=UPI0027133F8F|nr:hypothetical protein [Hymenobacter sp. CA1UV-4]MDO7851316.1 hypothetical protein [Hymenobacter sp. CA1UV-4]